MVGDLMNDFIKGYNGDFIYISSEIFPPTSFLYRDRTIIKQESVYDIKEYVLRMSKLMEIGDLNMKLFQDNIDDVLELIMNEKGIHKISLKI